MSDSDLKLHSSIELSDIRKLDSLLTQCETSSCENICIDCCAKLGSLDEDDDPNGNSQESSGSAIIPTPPDVVRITNEMKREKPTILRQSAVSGDAVGRHEVINNVPTIISSYVSSEEPSSSKESVSSSQAKRKPTPKLDNSFGEPNSLAVQGSLPLKRSETKFCSRCGGVKGPEAGAPAARPPSCSIDQDCGGQTLFSNHNELNKGGSENALECQKQYSLESSHKASSSVKQLSLSSACEKCDIGKSGKSLPPDGAAVAGTSKRHLHRGGHVASSLKDKSNKSSQISLNRGRSRKSSLFHFAAADEGEGNASRHKRSAPHRKASRGPYLHEELDAETREILLGGTPHTSKLEALKIPEPVEAVG